MGKDFKKQLVFEAKELNYTSVDEDFLQRAIDCVHRHLDDPDFDQAKLLEEMYMAKSTFFRKLKSLTGLTYVSFIRNIRMKAPGGSLEPYAPDKCIGGSRFGNYEGLLPEADGRTYTECDIDTLGADSRGAKRIVFSNDGLIYYTEDHYKSFELLYGEE